MTKKYISNKPETVRMFESDFLESLSKIHWTVPLFVYIPVIIFFLYRTWFQLNIPIKSMIFLFIVGLIIWTFVEYSLHRFVFHYVPSSEFGKKLHFIFHGVHHDYPKDPLRLVMPPSVSLPIAVLFYIIFHYIIGNVLVAPFFAGFILGYLFYDITHYAVHHFNIKSKFWKAIKDHHMIHHYKHDTLGFGVSQPAWDYIFGTTYPDKDDEV
ncbi:MAG: sterol desaturase family protein [bacterium]